MAGQTDINGYLKVSLGSGGVISGDQTFTGNITIEGDLILGNTGADSLAMTGPLDFTSGVAVTAGNYEIVRDADATNQLHFNVPTGASFEFSIQDVATLVLNANQLSLSASKYLINGMQTMYLPDQDAGAFQGSLFIGNGGASLTHASGTQGQQNHGMGIGSLFSITSGAFNNAMGAQSLYNLTTGTQNTAQGERSQYTLTEGTQNTSVGAYSLQNNIIGNYNTAIGVAALLPNLSDKNVGIGMQSLRQNTTGSENVAIGYRAIYVNTTGTKNTAIGTLAGSDLLNVLGVGNNTLIGYGTGLGITTGVGNTILGANVIGLSATLSYNIIIADGAGNRRINVDGSGYVGIGTTTPTGILHVLGGTAETQVVGTPITITSQKGGASDGILDGKDGGDLLLSAGAPGDPSGMGGYGLPGKLILQGSNSGNVGIGTLTPAYKLDVATGDINLGAGAVRINNNGIQIIATGALAATGTWDMYKTGDLNASVRFFHSVDTRTFTIATGNGTTGAVERLSILSSGQVGIGITTPEAQFEIEQADSTSGVPIALKVNGGTHTTLANSDFFDVKFDLDREVEFSGSAGSDVIAVALGVTFNPAVYKTAGAGDLTITNASTVVINGAPTTVAGGGGTTITNPFALYVTDGATYLGGSLSVMGVGGIYTTYGMTSGAVIQAPSYQAYYDAAHFLDLAMSYHTFSMSTTGGISVGLDTNGAMVDVKSVGSIGAASFTGSGLNDMAAGGSYNGNDASAVVYTVEIDATGTPDTFKWKKGSGSYTTGVAIDGTVQTLSDGVGVLFTSTTGHTLSDYWESTVTPLDILNLRGADGTLKMEVLNDGTVSFQGLSSVLNTGSFRIPGGSFSDLGISFIGDDDTGFYTSGSGSIRIQSNGDTVARFGEIVDTVLFMQRNLTGATNPTILNLQGGNQDATAASTEVNDVFFNLANSGRYVEFATGALTTQRAVLINQPTYKFVGASTLSNAATFAIVGAPIAGTNATITNPISLWVQAGRTRLDGFISYGPAISATIASGAIAITSSNYKVVVEGGTGAGADALTSATGGLDGDVLILRAATSGANDTVTVTDGTGAGAFIMAGGSNFVMDHIDDRIQFLHNGTEWVEQFRSDNS